MAKKQTAKRLMPAVPEQESLKVHGDKLADASKGRPVAGRSAKPPHGGQRSGGKS
jgi:hypothetical protein